jgi:cysteinyl-tRNA synthetase
MDAKGFEHLNRIVSIYFRGILGIQELLSGSSNHLDSVLQVLIDMRAQAKADKNFALSDLIRDKLKTSGIEIMDSKEGSTWRIID